MAIASSVKRNNIPRNSENQNIENEENIPRNNVTEEISTVGSKKPDSKERKIDAENNERDDRNENSGKKERNPSSSSSALHLKRKPRQSILLPFLDDISSPESPVRERDWKSNRQLSRRMTLSPASARSLMMQVIEDEAREKSVTPISPINLEKTIVLEREGEVSSSASPVQCDSKPSGRTAVDITSNSQCVTDIEVLSPVCTLYSPSLSNISLPLNPQQEVSAYQEEKIIGDKSSIDDDPCLTHSMRSTKSDDNASIFVARGKESQNIAVEDTEEIVEQSQGTMDLRNMEFHREEEVILESRLESADTVDQNDEVIVSEICASTSPVESVSTDGMVRTSPGRSTFVSTDRTYSVELDALLDSDSDVSTSTTSSTLASDSYSTSSPTGNRDKSFAEFCANSETECANSPIPIEVQYASGGSERVRKEDSFDVLFSDDAPADCSEVIEMDMTENTRLLLNNAFMDNSKGHASICDEKSSYSPSSSPKATSMIVSQEPTLIDSKINDMEVIVDSEHEEKVLVRKRVQDVVIHDDPVKKIKVAGSVTPIAVYEEVLEMISGGHSKGQLATTEVVPILKIKEETTYYENSPPPKVHDIQVTATTTSASNKMDSSSSDRVEFNRTFVGPGSATASGEPDSTGSSVHFINSSSRTLEEAHQRALGRLNIRHDTALWKYHWEMASFCAAQAAREKKGEV